MEKNSTRVLGQETYYGRLKTKPECCFPHCICGSAITGLLHLLSLYVQIVKVLLGALNGS